jgi:CHAD domain-containing protein
MPDVMREIEAKFLIADAAEAEAVLSVLKVHAALRPKQPLEVVDIYLDSPDLGLWRAGYGCRIRKKTTADGTCTWSLECKSIGSGAEPVKFRDEVEQSLAGTVDPDHLPATGPVIDCLRAKGISHPVPIVSLSNLRQRFRATFGSASFEVSVDEVEVKSGKGAPIRRFRELEIEWIDGPVESLHALVETLRERLTLCVSRLGKMERGFWLGGRYPCSNRRFQVAEPAAWLQRAQLQLDLRIIALSREVALEGRDPEGIHRLRTHVRRVRATLAACDAWLGQDAVDFNQRFKALADAVGELRDHDVYTATTLKLLDGMAALATGTRARMVQLLEAERAEITHRASGVLVSPGVVRLFAQFQAALDQPAAGTLPSLAALAARELAKRTRSVRKGVVQLVRGGSDEALHELRIRVKKLRYVLELFEPVLGQRLQSLTTLLRDVQDVLGEHQDACVAIIRGRELAQKVPLLPENREVLMTFGRLHQVRERTVAAIRGRFVARKGRKALARDVGKAIRNL